MNVRDRQAGHLASLAKGMSIFAGSAEAKLGLLRDELAPLATRYDVVVANPPYMGSSSLNRWEGAWLKRRYPEEYRDLCTCFIERGFAFCDGHGANAMVTMQSWMFLGSYERMRGKLLANHSIVSMAHLGTRAFGAIAGEVVSTTATVFGKAPSDVPGAYFRLVDMGSEEEKRTGLLEALSDPGCGWFYRKSAGSFEIIPGNPIAYWTSTSMIANYVNGEGTLADHGRFLNGMSTGNNESVLRLWQEVSVSKIAFKAASQHELECMGKRYVPYNKGGEFRKWWGNQESIIAYDQESNVLMDSFVGHRHNNPDTYFHRCLSWSKVSSGVLAMRFIPDGFVYDVAGCSLFCNRQGTMGYLLALYNSSVAMGYLRILSPTLNFEAGQIKKIPYITPPDPSLIELRVGENVNTAQKDWSIHETSWDFNKHPLV